MISDQHFVHLARRTSYNNCGECRADTERQFVPVTRWTYGHVASYMAYVRPRLVAIRGGDATVEARRWYREFRTALHRRISLKTRPPFGRKYCDSYLERLRAIERVHPSAPYLRTFARRGASCL